MRLKAICCLGILCSVMSVFGVNTIKPYSHSAVLNKFVKEPIVETVEANITYTASDCGMPTMVFETLYKDYTDYELLPNKKYHGQKSYEYYTAITNKSSNAYKLQEVCITDFNGFRRFEDKYVIAVGTYFNAPVGTALTLVLENDTEIECVVGDIKADIHTDTNNIYSKCGCASEFIVDKNFTELTNCKGDVSSVFEDWDSKVKKVRVYDGNYFD